MDVLKLLTDYGALGILIILIVTGLLVPKAYYDREIKRGDAATLATATTSEALRLNAENIKSLVAEVASLREEVKGLRDDVRAKSAGG